MAELKLSKKVPARRKTFVARACRKDFREMTPQFRAIRSGSRNPMDKCHWCKHPFVDGEMMALAFTNKGNKTLCQKCADELLAEGE